MIISDELEVVAKWLGGPRSFRWSPGDDECATFAEWDEIYRHMNEFETSCYWAELMNNGESNWQIHTLKPSLRFSALVKAIQQKGCE